MAGFEGAGFAGAGEGVAGLEGVLADGEGVCRVDVGDCEFFVFGYGMQGPQQEAWVVKENRRRGEEDEDMVHEWEQVLQECDFEADGWDKKVQASKPNVEYDTAVLEVKKLQEQMNEMKDIFPISFNGYQ